MMAAGYLLPRHEEEGDFDNTDIVRILAEHGADINTKDKSGKLLYY